MKTLTTLFIIFLSSIVIQAQQAKPKSTNLDDPNTMIQSTIEDYRKKFATFNDEVKAIKITKDRMAYYEKNKPDPEKQVDKVMQFIEANPQAKHAGAGLLWTLQNGNPSQTTRAKKIIFDHYKNDQVMGMYAFWVYQKGMIAIPELKTISQASDNVDVKENATFYHATLLNKISMKLKDPEEIRKNRSEAAELFKAILSAPDLESRNKKLFDLATKQAESLKKQLK